MDNIKNCINLPVFDRLMKTITRALVVERHTYFRGLPKEERYFRLHILLNDSEFEIEDHFRVDPELRIHLENENKAKIKQVYIISIDNRDSPLHNFEVHAYRFSNGEVAIRECYVQKNTPEFVCKLFGEMRATIEEVASKQLIQTDEGRSVLYPCHEYFIFRHINDDSMSSEAVSGYISMKSRNLDLYFETRGQIRIYREVFNRNYLNL